MASPLSIKSVEPTLSSLLGCPGEQRELGEIRDTARLAVALLTESLGWNFVDRMLPTSISEELATPHTAIVRHSPRRDRNNLFGLGLPSPYVALSLRVGDETAGGVRALQALIFGGLLIRHRTGTKPSAARIDAIAQFLVGTSDARDKKVQRGREAFLASLGIGINADRILSAAKSSAGLPQALLPALTALLGELQRARRPGDVVGPGGRLGPRAPAPKLPRPLALIEGPERDIELALGSAMPLGASHIAHAEDAGESQSEQTSMTFSQLVESAPDATIHQRAAHARRAFMDVRQAPWARDQWDALTSGEMRGAVARWRERATEALEASNRVELEASLLVLLEGCTGWNDAQIWSTPLLSGLAALPKGHDRAILLDQGAITFLAPVQGARYNPVKRGQAMLVRAVSDRVIQPLPSSIVTLLRAYRASREGGEVHWLLTDLPKLLEVVRSHQARTREDEPRETIARIRNAHLLELLQVSRDVPLAQLVSGEFLGATDVGLAYAAYPRDRLHAVYTTACSQHGYGDCGAVSDGNGLVGGSQLQLETTAVRKVAAHNRTALGQPAGYLNATRTEKRKLQGVLAPAVAWLACSGTGFRPGDNVGRLTRYNFSFRGRCAVVGEKILDEGHLGRLVPLCPMLLKALVAYGHHLAALAVDKDISQPLRLAASAALDGSGPIFFVPTTGGVRALTGEDMRKRLPRGWKLPSNAFRHRLATELRVHGCPGIYVEALLGHVAWGTQPFGTESFMEPQAFLETTAEAAEAVLLRDGWKPLHGLPAANTPPWDPISLGPWVMKLIPDHLASIKRLRSKHRDERDIYRKERGSAARARVRMHLEDGVLGFTGKGGTIDADAVRDLRRSLTQEAESLAEIEVVVDALRAELQTARDDRGWKIPRLPYFHLAQVEPSPFSPSFPTAYDSLLHLRDYFAGLLNGRQRGTGVLGARIRLLLALVLWHGICDWPRLQSVFLNLYRARVVEGLEDAIAIPVEIAGCPESESVELLRGPVAIAALCLLKQGQTIVHKKSLGQELARVLPSWITQESGESLINILLEAARIAHFFEHSPPLRDVWTGSSSSTGLSLARITSLLSGKLYSAAPRCQDIADEEPALCKEATIPSRKPKEVMQDYSHLRNILRIPKARPKVMPTSGASFPSGADAALLRPALVEEIDAFLAGARQKSPLITLLARYARTLLLPAADGQKLVLPRTVYAYVVHVGGSLARTSPNAPLLHLEADELFDLYKLAVDQSKPKYQPWVATYLSYFHSYLARAHGCPSVDLRGMGGSISGVPDVGVVSPIEYKQVSEILRTGTAPESFGSTYEARRASQAFAVGYASGARSAEIAMREQRDLVHEEGRQVLLVRRNRLGGVKTKRASRVISLDASLAPVLAEIRMDNAAILRTPLATHPLFPDSTDPRLPIEPDVFSSLIGSALRFVTGEPRARQYWLRHNAASLEFLLLLADQTLVDAIAKQTQPGEVPFTLHLAPRDFALQLAGHHDLSEAHAAAFRSRRGHASLQTSLTTYIHTVGMVEPLASRRAFACLTSVGIAALSGRSPEWVRQAIHRASMSRFDIAGPRAAIVNALAPTEIEHTNRPEGPMPPVKRFRVSIGAVRRCSEDYFRSGKIELAMVRLHATPGAKEVIQRALIELPLTVHAGERPRKRRSGDQQSPLLLSAPRVIPREQWIGDKSIDGMALDAIVERARCLGKTQLHNEMPIWEAILSGADPEGRVIRCASLEDLRLVATGLTTVLRAAMPHHEVVVVAPGEGIADRIGPELGRHELGYLKIINRPLPPFLGSVLPVGLGVQSKGGQLRLATILLAAVVLTTWNKLLLSH